MEADDPIAWWQQQGRQQWLEMIERMEKEEKELKNDRQENGA